MHIHCPKGVYDINIEPAKDDILFEDPQLVLSLVESLFRDSYGELPSAEDRHQGSTKKDKPISTNGFELLLARKGTDAAPPHQSSNKDVIPGPVVTPSSSWKLPSSASRPYHSHDKEQAQETSQIAGSESQSKDRESLNPWVLTKMNTPNRLPTSSCPTHDEIRRLSIPKITKESTNPRRSSKHNSQQSLSSSAIPSSNSASRSTSTSPSNARHPASPFQVPTQRSPTTVPDSLKRSRERDRERYGNGAIDTWFEKTNRVAPLQGPDESELEQVEPSLTQLAETRFGSQSRPSSRSETSTQGFGFRTAREIMESPNPFELPRQNYFSSGRHSRSPEVEDSFHELPTPEESPCRMPGLSGFRNNPGLNDALDFERRKKEVIQKRREQMRAGAEPTNSPHHSRYLAAKAALATDSNPALQSRSTSSEENTSESTLSRDDPRAYLMRQKNIQQENGLTNRGPKIQRTQTRRLPFEKIPEGSDAHNLCVTFPATITSVSDSFTQAADTDIYTRTGMDFQAFLSPTPDDVFQTWRDRLSVLVASKYRTKDGSQPPSLEFDLSAIIDHFDSFSEA